MLFHYTSALSNTWKSAKLGVISGSPLQVRILWYNGEQRFLCCWQSDHKKDIVDSNQEKSWLCFQLYFPNLKDWIGSLYELPLDISSPMPCSVQSCSGACPVRLWLSARMEIIQHLQTSWRFQPMMLHWKRCYQKSPEFRLGRGSTRLSSYVCHWALCPCWAWKLWQDVLQQSLWESGQDVSLQLFAKCNRFEPRAEGGVLCLHWPDVDSCWLNSPVQHGNGSAGNCSGKP